jgi:hypothetical protein
MKVVPHLAMASLLGFGRSSAADELRNSTQ